MKVGVFRYHIRTSLAVIGVLLSALVMRSQTSSQNYVRTIEPLFADSFDVVPYWDMARISTAYYDGLGREVQRVDEGASPDFGDVATFSVTHDVCGRVVTDSGRGINNIAYNPSGLPTRIDIYSFTDSVNGHAYNDQVLIEYRSDGVKRAETTCHRYMGIIVQMHNHMHFFCPIHF